MKLVRTAIIAAMLVGGISFATSAEEKKLETKDPPATITNKDDRKIIDQGTVIGKVAKIGDRFIEVTSESGKTAQYMAEWKGGNSGGPDKSIVAAIEKLKVGDTVKIEWYVNDHIRIKKIDKVEAAAGAKEEKKK